MVIIFDLMSEANHLIQTAFTVALLLGKGLAIYFKHLLLMARRASGSQVAIKASNWATFKIARDRTLLHNQSHVGNHRDQLCGKVRPQDPEVFM